jgi:hypothetical protein
MVREHHGSRAVIQPIFSGWQYRSTSDPARRTVGVGNHLRPLRPCLTASAVSGLYDCRLLMSRYYWLTVHRSSSCFRPFTQTLSSHELFNDVSGPRRAEITGFLTASKPGVRTAACGEVLYRFQSRPRPFFGPAHCFVVGDFWSALATSCLPAIFRTSGAEACIVGEFDSTSATT